MRHALQRAVVAGLVLVAGCATPPSRTSSPDPSEREAPGRSSDRQVIERILESSVQVVLERNGTRYRTASGVVLAARSDPPGDTCFVLTSGHALAGVREGDDNELYALVGRHRGAAMRLRSQLLMRRDDGQVDLALLRVPTPRCPGARLGPPPSLGDRIWIVGFPWGRQIRLMSGIVSQVRLDDGEGAGGGAALMVDASVAYGMSGSGVFDATSGRLVGLVEGYGTARVAFGEKPAGQYIEVPVPGETYVTSVDAIRTFLRTAPLDSCCRSD
jgi:hypothetical protein